jgi:hypothetical protein
VVSAEDLGGADVHTRLSGVADHFAEDEAHALQRCRSIVAHLNTRKQVRSPSWVPDAPCPHLVPMPRPAAARKPRLRDPTAAGSSPENRATGTHRLRSRSRFRSRPSLTPLVIPPIRRSAAPAMGPAARLQRAPSLRARARWTRDHGLPPTADAFPSIGGDQDLDQPDPAQQFRPRGAFAARRPASCCTYHGLPRRRRRGL